MSNQYIETGNNQRPSLTMWQYYRRAWTFPREKRASLREGRMVFWGMCLSSIILGFFIIIIIEILSGGQDTLNFSSLGEHVATDLFATLIIGAIPFLLQLFTIPGLPLFIRRVHDIGKNPWLILLIVMILFWPAYIICFISNEGDPGTNKYGPPPSL